MKYTLLTLVAAWFATSASQAQTAEALFHSYRFSEAQNKLQNEIKLLKKKRLDATPKEELLDAVRRGESMLSATEKVVVVDSFVVDKASFLSKMKLNEECGTLLPTARLLQNNVPDSLTACINGRGTMAYLALPQKDGTSRLYACDNLGGKWQNPEPLKGLEDDGDEQNYPYMCADGITFYFAAKGSESLGGYDIFVTRYNNDDKSFLRPENVGMPFNSPANDYMMAIDEINNLGWFATDRRQPEGKVCIYVFIPSEVRNVYNYNPETAEQVKRAAQISSLSDSWNNKQTVNAARERLMAALTHVPGSKKKAAQPAERFVINDATIYASEGNFRSPQAKASYLKWKEMQTLCGNNQKTLDAMRQQYATQPQSRGSLSASILQMEQQQFQLRQQLKTLAVEIRNLENTTLKKYNP